MELMAAVTFDKSEVDVRLFAASVSSVSVSEADPVNLGIQSG
jgi:hypothetical protein